MAGWFSANPYPSMMTPRQKTLLVLLPILLLALALRLIGIENPLFEREPSAWRQIHTNSTVQGYLQHGFKFFHPQVNFMGDPGYLAQEFPLYQYMVAWLYKIFGEDVLWGRLLTIATSLGALIYLYLILRRFFGEVAAAAGALYFALVPLSAYYGRTVMIDTPALFLSLGFTYHFLNYLQEGRGRSLGLALILSTLALLIKVTMAIIFWAPLLILPLLLGMRAVYRKGGFYLFLFVPLGAVYLWMRYAEKLNLRNPLTVKYAPRFLGYWIFGPWEMRLDPDFYLTLFQRAVHQNLTWVGMVLVGGGILLSFGQKRLRFLLVYLGAALGYLLTFTNLNFIHDYYQIPLLPVNAVFIGVFIGFALEKIKHYSVHMDPLRHHKVEKLLAPLLVILVGALMLGPSIKVLRTQSRIIDHPLMAAGKQVQLFLPPDVLVIAVTRDVQPLSQYPQSVIKNIQPKTLYAIGHRGWNLNYSNVSPSKIEELKKGGAQFLVMDMLSIFPQDEVWRDTVLRTLRNSYKELFGNERLLVFDLNNLPSSPKAQSFR